MAAATPETMDFERSLDELERLVERLEKGEVSLEEALQDFERGVTLAHACQSALTAAERRVEQLLATAEGERVVPFEPNDKDD